MKITHYRLKWYANVDSATPYASIDVLATPDYSEKDLEEYYSIRFSSSKKFEIIVIKKGHNSGNTYRVNTSEKTYDSYSSALVDVKLTVMGNISKFSKFIKK